MNITKSINDMFMSEKFEPNLRVHEGQTFKYEIEMRNNYLNQKGDVVKKQRLKSQYTKTVTESIKDSYHATEFNFDKIEYHIKDDKDVIRWSFAENMKIPYYMFCNKVSDKLDEEQSKLIWPMVKKQVQNFESCFTKLPKLPTAYLFIMQVYDVIAFELFSTYLVSTPNICETPGKEIEIEGLSSKQAKLGLGLYSDSSFFKNSQFYITFVGYSIYSGKTCAAFEYRCENSKVKMEDNNKFSNRQREGNSFYSGMIYLDVETGVPVFSSMYESYIAVQNEKGPNIDKKSNIHIRRDIRMTLIS